MSKSFSKTSIYFNYIEKGRRNIYGIEFPDGLSANQEFPMGTIITPTTKAKDGNDKELTQIEAKLIVDSKYGDGIWEKINIVSHNIFERAYIHCLARRLILADTKFEFGIDENGDLLLIDELLTPECSRFWLLDAYKASVKLKRNAILDFDKDVLSRWINKKLHQEKSSIPKINSRIIQKMLKAYNKPHKIIIGHNLPEPIYDEILLSKIALQTVRDFINLH